MTDTEHYKLLWLVNAMTLPIGYVDERYYYDGQRKEFFYTIRSGSNPASFGVLNMFDHHYANDIESDLAVRLELIEDEICEIVEIPRLNVADKVDIQLQFLSKMPGTYWHKELIQAVEEQRDDFKFVLDTVLIENDNAAPLASYWDDYKLQTVLDFISQFSSTIGVDFKLP